MRTVAEVLSVVAQSPCYGEVFGESLMCFALIYAKVRGIINTREYIAAKSAIHAYLQGFGTLQGALMMSGLPSSFEYRRAIYMDWDNRPRLTYYE